MVPFFVAQNMAEFGFSSTAEDVAKGHDLTGKVALGKIGGRNKPFTSLPYHTKSTVAAFTFWLVYIFNDYAQNAAHG